MPFKDEEIREAESENVNFCVKDYRDGGNRWFDDR